MWNVLLLAVGFVCLIKGADWFVEGASKLARRFGIPQLVVGLTIVAMGTSLPEAAVSISGALKGTAGIAVGNVVGSNIFNVLGILGLTALVTRLPIAKSTLVVEIPYMLAVTLVLLVVGVTGMRVSRPEGAILWGMFLLYLAYLWRLSRRTKESAEEKEERWGLGKCLGFLLLGGVLVLAGAELTVDAARELAAMLGFSERFIGLTIVAIGTSLPELVTSLVAAKKGHTDIAIGNIVGSNIFNILFVVGTASLIAPVPFEKAFVSDTLVAFAAGLLLWLGVCRKKELRRRTGAVMLLGYVAYVVCLLL